MPAKGTRPIVHRSGPAPVLAQGGPPESSPWYRLWFNKRQGFARWRERKAAAVTAKEEAAAAAAKAAAAAAEAAKQKALEDRLHQTAQKITTNALKGLQAKTIETKKAALETCAQLATANSDVLNQAIAIEDIARAALKDVTKESIDGGLDEIVARVQPSLQA